MKKLIAPVLFYIFVAGIFGLALRAQNPQSAGPTPVQHNQSLYYTIPIAATAAVNTATTLTIPAPAPGLYNYVCRLAWNLSNDNTGTVATQVVSSSTNFNAFAVKTSEVATASANYDSPTMIWGDPSTGCAKSTSPGTATTFVSPAGVTHGSWTWYATYYQAP